LAYVYNVAAVRAHGPPSFLARVENGRSRPRVSDLMPTLSEIFRINDTLVYFVYGQVFFSLGLVVALHSRRHSRLELARQLTWLASFGLTHGLHEWAHIFVPIQATYLPASTIAALNGLRIALLATSFFFLGEFGNLVTFEDRGTRRLVQSVFGTLLAAWVIWAFFLIDATATPDYLFAESWARRIMGLPSAALASVGLARQARLLARSGLSGIARDFWLASAALAAYAFLVGLIVPFPNPPDTMPSIYRPAVEILGVPVPVLRSMAGLGIALGIVRGLRIFEMETERRLEKAERARLEASERARAAMEAMAVTISDQRELETMLEAALKQLLALTASPGGWLVLHNARSGKIEIRSCVGLDTATPADGTPCGLDAGCACKKILRTGRASVARTAIPCIRWPAELLRQGTISIPLIAHGHAVGVAHLLATGGTETEMLGILTSMGRQLGLAVENAQLAEEVARKEAARAQLLRKVITAQEEERRRVARELHDQTGQSLTAVIMTLGAAAERMTRGPRNVAALIGEAREIAMQGLESTRGVIMGLRPPVLDDLGLVPALRRHIEDLSRRGGIEVQLESDGLERRPPRDVEIVVFRILQEALNNVIRHSRAKHAIVRLRDTGGEIRAEVSDDGIGFDATEARAHPESGRGLGLLGMMERAELLGGEVMLETAPGRGTRLVVRVPLTRGGLP